MSDQYGPHYAPTPIERPPEAMPPGQIAGLIALSCCIPVIGPIISLIIGIAGIKRPGAVWVLVGAALLFCLSAPLLLGFALAFPTYNSTYDRLMDKSNEAMAKAYLHRIELAIQQYATSHAGEYPWSITLLHSEGLLRPYPDNPFTEDELMKNIDFQDEHNPGDYTYIVHTDSSGTQQYYLFVYGGNYVPKPGPLDFADPSLTYPDNSPSYSDINQDGVDDNVILLLSSDPAAEANLPGILNNMPAEQSESGTEN